MIITYLVFGSNNSNYRQAFFSILTCLAQKDNSDTIVIITDRPMNFELLKDRISLIPITEETLTDWKGKYDFFWRIKIKALQLVASRFDDQHILYLDADTFLFGNIGSIMRNLNKGDYIMHTNEGELCKQNSKTERIMWKQLKYRTYSGIEINSKTCMWNAGVLGISRQNRVKLGQVLEVCDQMCSENVTRRLIEQLAFSIVFDDSAFLLAAENEIGHYWGNKKDWNNIINEFISESFMTNSTFEQQIEKVAGLNFEEIPTRIKIPNTRMRLEKKLSKFFPDKERVYIPKS